MNKIKYIEENSTQIRKKRHFRFRTIWEKNFTLAPAKMTLHLGKAWSGAKWDRQHTPRYFAVRKNRKFQNSHKNLTREARTTS